MHDGHITSTKQYKKNMCLIIVSYEDCNVKENNMKIPRSRSTARLFACGNTSCTCRSMVFSISSDDTTDWSESAALDEASV